VLAHDPVAQVGQIFKNTLRQLVWIDYDGLNVGCWDKADCWQTLPDEIKSKLAGTPSGQNAWPQHFMNIVLYLTVITSLIALTLYSGRIKHLKEDDAQFLRIFFVAAFTAFLVSALFGGGVAQPQYRYTGRIIWLVPFAAATLLALVVRHSRGGLDLFGLKT
jgi:hypothetical protein